MPQAYPRLSASEVQRGELLSVWIFLEPHQWIWGTARENESILNFPNRPFLEKHQTCILIFILHYYRYQQFILCFLLHNLGRTLFGCFSDLKWQTLPFRSVWNFSYGSSLFFSNTSSFSISLIHTHIHICVHTLTYIWIIQVNICIFIYCQD